MFSREGVHKTDQMLCGAGGTILIGRIEKGSRIIVRHGFHFTVVEQDGDGIYVVSHEDSDGLLTVQIYYEGGSGTIQITDKR